MHLINVLESVRTNIGLQTVEMREGSIRVLERVPRVETTHILQVRASLISEVKVEPGTAATHFLQSQGKAWSAGFKVC